jgi:CHAT domain-containing protein
LYQRIFYSPAADAQANLLGDRLREMAQRDVLKIQIFSQHFMLPWGILYVADEFDPDRVEPELFLGLKHIIEHIPLQQTMRVIDGTVQSDPSLTVSLNVNADIDQQMGLPFIANQVADWEKISQGGGARLIVRKSKDEVTQALADDSTPDQILYFYCHAISKSLAEGGGPDASTLVLSGQGHLTLEDLNLFAPTKKALSGAPLVFINACESAELSPLFYDGFVPYFMAKGARGVIGTECETPALFAAEWAKRFFRHFLTGKSLGQAFLDLRREFYYQHNNLMGLLYALYCDGDTQVVPGLQLTN